MPLTYEEWMKEVDRYLEAALGVTSDDLADQTYHDWYDDGMTPDDVAAMVLESEGM